MSVVVAVKDLENGTVWLGADSAGTGADFSQANFQNPKVFRVGPLGFGFTGSYRLGQLLQYHADFREPLPDEDPLRYIVTVVVEELRGLFQDTGFAAQDDNGRETGGDFVVAFQGNIYVVQSDWSVLVPSMPYYALGEGAPFALGALLMSGSLSPAEKTYKALEAAEEFCASVRRPFVVLPVGGERNAPAGK